MKRELALLGDPALRQRAKKVEKITPEIQLLAEDLVKHAEGGLAAPQISKR